MPDTCMEVNVQGVLAQLKRLNPHKACGPDNISPLILKTLADLIAPFLTRIIQVSLNKGSVHMDWKRANVCPIFKKGER